MQQLKWFKGSKVAAGVTAIAVPGSYQVKKDAEAEGIDKIFLDAGWEWREPGCSMCLAMNGDQLKPQERCASTSNRNFEGRQGKGGSYAFGVACYGCRNRSGRSLRRHSYS